MRRLYVEQLKKIVPKTARVFLLTIEVYKLSSKVVLNSWIYLVPKLQRL